MDLDENDLITSTKNRAREGGQNFLVYGPSGIGKTYMARTCDGDALILSAESGTASLADVDVDCINLLEVKRRMRRAVEQEHDAELSRGEGPGIMDAVMWAYRKVESGTLDYDWLVPDSISEIAEVYLDECLARNKHGQAAYGEMAERVVKMLRAFRSLDVNVYFSAKQRRETIDGSLTYYPSMPGRKLVHKRPITHDFDYVFAMQLVEGDGEYRRVLQTEPGNGYEAKSRDPFGRLSRFEEPDLGAIRRKVSGTPSDESAPEDNTANDDTPAGKS